MRTSFNNELLGPDYLEAGYASRQVGSFAEIRIKLILYAKNCLVKRAHTAESTYVILEWQVPQNDFGMNSIMYRHRHRHGFRLAYG